MKVAFLIHRIPVSPSGGVKVIYEYANYMASKGHEVTLYYQTDSFMKRHQYIPKIVKHTIAQFFAAFFINWFPLDKSIRRKLCFSSKMIKSADIIFATEIRTVDCVYNLPDEIGKKGYFIQGFEDWNYPTEYVYETYGYNMLNIVVSNWLKKIVDKYSKTPSFLVSNCIDSKIFYNKRMKRIPHSIVFHYRDASYKGCMYAIKAIEQLKEIYKDLTVNVISVTKKLPAFPDYFNSYICIKPEEVADINNRSEIFMCSSIKEGFGLPGLEAMACGCILVSSTYDGVLEYAVDNYNALLVPSKDADALVEKTVYAFENPDIKKIQINGIRSAQDRSLEKSQTKFCEIVENYCLGNI